MIKTILVLILMFGFYVDVKPQDATSTDAGSKGESVYGFSHGQGV